MNAYIMFLLTIENNLFSNLRYVLKNLKPGSLVVIVDYKMKVELGMHAREIQRDWYGKRGISLHGFYVVAQTGPDERVNEVIDLWSEDSKQDAWFTCSALDIGFQWLEKAFPGYNVYLFSGRFICTYFFYKYAVLFNCRRLMKCTEQFVLYSKKINKQAELAVHFLLY